MQVSVFKAFSIVAALLLAGAGAHAAPNLVTNGSFEAGMTGWTHSGTPVSSTMATYPVVAINYGSATPYPTGAYGEAVVMANDATLSPDAAGGHAAYFVDDAAANESLSQSIFLRAGSYRVGFDVYAPNNGYGNANDAFFSAQIAGMNLAGYMVSSRPSVTWTNYSGLVTILNAGLYSASFVFSTPGLGVAKDIVIDRVFVVAANEAGGLVIPEPGSLALFGIAFTALAVARTRRTA